MRSALTSETPGPVLRADSAPCGREKGARPASRGRAPAEGTIERRFGAAEIRKLDDALGLALGVTAVTTEVRVRTSDSPFGVLVRDIVRTEREDIHDALRLVDAENTAPLGRPIEAQGRRPATGERTGLGRKRLRFVPQLVEENGEERTKRAAAQAVRRDDARDLAMQAKPVRRLSVALPGSTAWARRRRRCCRRGR